MNKTTAQSSSSQKTASVGKWRLVKIYSQYAIGEFNKLLNEDTPGIPKWDKIYFAGLLNIPLVYSGVDWLDLDADFKSVFVLAKRETEKDESEGQEDEIVISGPENPFSDLPNVELHAKGDLSVALKSIVEIGDILFMRGFSTTSNRQTIQYSLDSKNSGDERIEIILFRPSDAVKLEDMLFDLREKMESEKNVFQFRYFEDVDSRRTNNFVVEMVEPRVG